jgi:DNA (cytosine-5)-methyltransferase 1
MAFTFYEFFAGGGMVSQGLGSRWRCLFANDIDPRKACSYCANNDPAPFRLADVTHLTTRDLAGAADLAWASFPCQDLSLAGAGRGLRGARSGTFWPFWRLMEGLAAEGRAPAIIALENVVGAVTSHGGKDLAAIGDAFAALGYWFTCLVIDAVLFVPQSRPRLFIVGVRGDFSPPSAARSEARWMMTPALEAAVEKFSAETKARLFDADLPAPPLRNSTLDAVIEAERRGIGWHSPGKTAHILSLMDGVNSAKVRAAIGSGRRQFGTIYRRMRPDGLGGRSQRAEVRFDGVAGCLRTPAGGSSRQILIGVEEGRTRTRLLSPREAARLMGLQDGYVLPNRVTEAYHLLGDGVAVPVVRYLATELIEPLLRSHVAAAA